MNAAVKLDEIYTYKDYYNWDDNLRWELIDGVPYQMSPAPSRRHQDIARELLVIIANYLKGKKCKVYAAPFDVRLPDGKENDDEILTVVQPDISIICDESKLDDRGCKGAPDVIIEIISPSTGIYDEKNKLDIYEKHRVKQYWMVYPVEKIIMVYLLNNDGEYGNPRNYLENDVIEPTQFPGLKVELEIVFG